MRIDFTCDLCGLPVRDDSFTSDLAEKTYRYCCMGCKQVFHMLWEAADTGDPAQFKETELFKKCLDACPVGALIPPDATKHIESME